MSEQLPSTRHATLHTNRAEIKLVLFPNHVPQRVANFVELSMVIESQIGPDAGRQCDAFFRSAGIVIEPLTVEQGLIARQAFLDCGKGRHPAGLNYGDCFAYALTKATGEPLLFKGQDFSRTDIRSAA